MVPPVNIINIYGQQESRTSKDDITASWLRLEKDLEDIESRGEALLLLGDLNRAIGSDQLGITGNNDKVSHGGQLIRDMMVEKDYVVLNNMASGGPWTWVQRGNNSIKSCLDIALV